jgi:transposase
VVTCPAGKQSISWLPNSYLQNGVVFEARFARKDCAACPHRARCTRSKLEPRTIGLQAREYHEALRTARQRQKTKEFRSQYAARAGIEGTHEQAIRRCGLRQCRYLGQAKTRLQHVLTATAINLVRFNDWWTARPHAQTRVSHFATLTQAA